MNDESGTDPSSQEISTTTQRIVTSMKCTKLVLAAELPPNTSIEATVKQDLTGDGEADNEQAVVAKDGEHTYDLDAFEFGGQQYWTEFTLRTEDPQHKPSIVSSSLEGERLTEFDPESDPER